MGLLGWLFGGKVNKECYRECMEKCVWSCIKWYTHNDPGVPPNLVRYDCEKGCKKPCKEECREK